MAKVKELSASCGVSAEINGVWHKFNFGITVEVEKGDNTSKIKEMLWDTCYVEVEKQIKSITG